MPLPRLKSAASAVMLLCDIQEKFRNVIFEFPRVVNTANRMLLSARVLDVPVIATEQVRGRMGLRDRCSCIERMRPLTRHSIPRAWEGW